jgi:hypothetical protein
MKKSILLSLFVTMGFLGMSQPNHPKSPHDTVASKNIKVTYGRPYKNGRVIFGKLEPFGKVYRCGADEATTISFAKDGTFGGKPVKAGTYTMFVIPNPNSWTVILNSQLGQWGAFSYDKYKDKDVLHVDVPVKKISPTVEQLTISLPENAMDIKWDDTEVSVPYNFG